MVVGTGIIDIVITGSRSLKEKRAVLRRILGRTKNTFNISIAEVGQSDDWKKCRIGFSIVGNERRFINSKIDTILNFVEGMNLADIINVDTEIYSVSDSGPGHGESTLHEFQES